MPRQDARTREIKLPPLGLTGLLTVPKAARGLVIFAHGSGSSRLSSRNSRVAEALGSAGLATLLFDLLGAEEAADRNRAFDFRLIADRLLQAMDWCAGETAAAELPVGLFGASTGAAAALRAAALAPDRVAAVVSRGGRPDLAVGDLASVKAPTLLIVGELDDVVIDLNRAAMRRLRCRKRLEIVPGASHLFEEPGALDVVTHLARDWFLMHLETSSVT